MAGVLARIPRTGRRRGLATVAAAAAMAAAVPLTLQALPGHRRPPGDHRQPAGRSARRSLGVQGRQRRSCCLLAAARRLRRKPGLGRRVRADQRRSAAPRRSDAACVETESWLRRSPASTSRPAKTQPAKVAERLRESIDGRGDVLVLPFPRVVHGSVFALCLPYGQDMRAAPRPVPALPRGTMWPWAYAANPFSSRQTGSSDLSRRNAPSSSSPSAATCHSPSLTCATMSSSATSPGSHCTTPPEASQSSIWRRGAKMAGASRGPARRMGRRSTALDVDAGSRRCEERRPPTPTRGVPSTSASAAAVDGLADDVSVTGVTSGLLDHVERHPAEVATGHLRPCTRRG